MNTYEPDFTNLVDAALNRMPSRLPLYEHMVSPVVLSVLTGKDIRDLLTGDERDREEGFRIAAEYLAGLGYDVFPYEGCMVELIQGGNGLMGRSGPLIESRRDIEEFPWEDIPNRYFDKFDPSFRALSRVLPPGMKAIAGVGNGLFEVVQDFVPLTDLAYLEIDDPEAFELLWVRVGDLLLTVWEEFIERHDEYFCLYRFGDDLGFKSSLLIKPETVRDHILPQYSRIIELIHTTGKPFLLHSCGAIFEIMEELISVCGIDAKHSNEDAIAPFDRWVEEYGGRIGLFGGIDMNILCTEDEAGIRAYVRELLERMSGTPGIAIGSGNQIADYVPPEGFLAMVEEINDCRGVS
ncbi:MAG: uroporphyrinogen decarboxylase family protein [Spirochaetia bacterium]